MAGVTFTDIKKSYGDNTVINSLDLEIKDQEFMVLVGPSGCGKSTALRMVAGLEEITGGTIAIGDRVVNDLAPKERDIAMVFQSYALYPHMTIRQNMAFGLQIRKMDQSEIDQRVNSAAEILGITQLLDRKPRALSGGQRQRVAVGRAIVRNPSVFLFDEPLSNLDAKLRVQMRAEISKLQHRLQTTTIYVTHDQVEAMTMGDRIALLKDGDLQQVGTPLELYSQPANSFVATFIGTPPMNLLRAELVEDGAAVSGQGFRLPLNDTQRAAAATAPGREIVVGIRPEHVVHGATEGGRTAPLTLEVEIVEPLGHETIVHGRLGSELITASLPPDLSPRPLEPFEVRVVLDELHLFAGENEIRLTP